MELQRRGERGHEIPIARVGNLDFDLRPLTGDIDGAFLASDGIREARRAIEQGLLPTVTLPPGTRYGAPIARPSAVMCIGLNYVAHAAESGTTAPEHPVLFFKHPNTVVGPFDDVCMPRGGTALDWEVELGIVIGTQARYLQTHEEAMACIAGYVVSNDVSERAFQIELSGGQWSKGKCAETFNPVGPSLIPAAEVDVQSLRLWSTVNGEPRQDSSTSDMIFSVAEIVRHLSQYLVLDPGDLINSGTPEGVALSGRFPYLGPGDVMELGIDGLGRHRQRVVEAG